MKKYKKQSKQQNGHTVPSTTDVQHPIQLTLDELVIAGAKQMIHQALDKEIEEILERKRYEHHPSGATKRYRNGYGKERNLTVGSGSFSLRVPRLREPFESEIVRHYQRYSDHIGKLFPDLYLHGLSTGDFRHCFELILGSDAPLSASSIGRMKQEWQAEYTEWKESRLEEDYLYVWADGVYPKAGPKNDQLAVLVLLGVNRNGEKRLLAIEEGYRESADSWREVLRSVKKRGVRWLGMVIADGALGLWAALRDVFPHTRFQRCWVHKMRNIMDKIPKSAHDEVLTALRELYNARSYAEAQQLKRSFIQRYKPLYPKAVASLQEPGEELFTYFQFPKEHWRSIKSTNAIESLFSAVKLRTNAARRIPSRTSGIAFVFKLLMERQTRIRKLNAFQLIEETIEYMKSKNHAKILNAA